MKSSTLGAIVNVHGPEITIDPGAALAHRLYQGGRLAINHNLTANVYHSNYNNMDTFCTTAL